MKMGLAILCAVAALLPGSAPWSGYLDVVLTGVALYWAYWAGASR